VERMRWRNERHMFVFRFKSPSRPAISIDVLIDEPVPFAAAYARRKVIQSAGGAVTIPVIGEEDLIAMKERVGRQQDLSDVEALRRKRERGR
jgi:hypothetical protein